MHDPLAPLLADGVIDEIMSRLKSGKEADLWLVRHGQEIVAAKVYKERLTRSFKNDAAYREGRQVRSSRTQRAMDKGSRFGQRASEEAWKAKEADALHALHAAGVRVPRPVIFYEGVLLMELVLDPAGHPAPRLIDAHVTREHAAPLYEDLRAQAVRMLCCDLIHGDLSPYNVLAGRDGPVIIDFPQVIGAAHNSQAERFFQRDLDNLRRFFEPIDPALRARAGDAHEIWRAYLRRELTPDFVPTGRHVEPPRQGRPEHARPEHGRHEQGRPEHGRTPAGAGEPARARGGPPPPDRGRGGRHGEERPRAGQRPDHRDRLDRREQRDAGDRTDRRDHRERSGPPRQPLGAGHAAPPGHPTHAPGRQPQPAAPRQGPPHAQRDGGRRPPDRPARREPPAPEVVRVTRPPPAPGGGPPRGPGQPGGEGPPGGRGSQGPRHGRRRGRGGRGR